MRGIYLKRLRLVSAVLIGLLVLGVQIGAQDTAPLEGIARGFPALRDLDGRTRADGDFAQWVEHKSPDMKITYYFPRPHRRGDGRVPAEAPARAGGLVVPEATGWGCTVSSKTSRAASVQKRENGDLNEWREEIDVPDVARDFSPAMRGI